MEKIIEIDLIDTNDLFEKYNRKKVSKDLINYIVISAAHFDKNDSIKIIVNNGFEDCGDIIKEGFKEEYNLSFKNHVHTNYVQAIYLIVGILILFFSTLIDGEVLREVILIGGWVLIWAMVELELFTDVNDRKRRKILKKLMHCKIVEEMMD